MSHEIQTVQPNPLEDPQAFEQLQRAAKMFAASQLIPEHLRGKTADVAIAMLMARRLNEDPLMVMQSMVLVKGRAGFYSKYKIARAIRSGEFRGRPTYRTTGKGQDLAVTCSWALADGQEIEQTITMQMAKADGWTKNPKYQSIPERMLQWRAASWLIDLYAPDVMLGVPTTEELEDIHAAPAASAATSPTRTGPAALGLPEPDAAPYIDAEIEDEPDPIPAEVVATKPKAKAAPEPAEPVQDEDEPRPWFDADDDL